MEAHAQSVVAYAAQKIPDSISEGCCTGLPEIKAPKTIEITEVLLQGKNGIMLVLARIDFSIAERCGVRV